MISERFSSQVYIADFTEFSNSPDAPELDDDGVVVSSEKNGQVPSFVVTDDNGYPFIVINNEKNPSMFKREDGSKVSQCECIVFAERNDNRKAWMMFLELKYCAAKNRFARIQEGIAQLKSTLKHVLYDTRQFDKDKFKPYLGISTPGISPLEPFDAFCFDQEYLLRLKEETGATLKEAVIAHIKTPSLLTFGNTFPPDMQLG